MVQHVASQKKRKNDNKITTVKLNNNLLIDDKIIDLILGTFILTVSTMKFILSVNL